MRTKKPGNHRSKANETIRGTLTKFIRNVKNERNDRTFKTYEITNTFNHDNKRIVSNARISALLREREQLQWVGNGTWVIL